MQYPLPLIIFMLLNGVYAKATTNHSVPALFVFGDSTVDPGNNNFIPTIVKSNFPPHGIDLPSHVPTGRFCNGKLTTDFIASHLGIKEMIPPFLDPTLSIEELTTGVSFASALTGYDPLTAQAGNVISLDKQLEYFKLYKARMELVMGKEKMEEHISKSGYVISAGTNDLVVNYFTLPFRRNQYTIVEYEDYLLQNTRNFIQGLLDLGARKIGIVGIAPIGCAPIVRILNFNAPLRDGCVESYTNVALEYNKKLQQLLQTITKENSGAQVVYFDIYRALDDIIRNYKQKGFAEQSKGCCGTGLLETAFLCNQHSYVCPDRSKFVFWDSIHPTEKTYNLIFLSFRDGIDRLLLGI
ncbi:hypothetical protein ACHQM5_017644 [Ranunculus cassubicifolius]